MNLINHHYEGRKFLLIYKTPHNTTMAVNYYSINNNLNSFLDGMCIWGVHGGESKISLDQKHSDFYVELAKEAYELFHQEWFKKAIENNFDVKIVFEYPF